MADNRGPSDEFERIAPATWQPGHEPEPPPAGGRGVPVGAVVLAVLVLLVAAGGWWWLPGLIGDDERTTATPAESAVAEPDATLDSSEQTGTASTPKPDADALLARRQSAQSLGDELAAARESLAGQGVDRWAPDEQRRMTDLAEQGQSQFEQREYAAAIDAFRAGLSIAGDLESRIDNELAAALERGGQALSDNRVDEAVAAFDLALAIDEDNADARRGADRAARRDEVLAAMRQGRASEQAGELDAAKEAYREARSLDEAYQPAGEAVQRVETALADRRFRARMSAGLAALDQGDFSAARSAFAEAARIRPGAAEAADGLAEAEAGLERAAIERLRQQAREAEQAEQWQDAVSAYEAMLDRDASLAQPRERLAHAREMADLNARLTAHLEQPKRLADAGVRNAVSELLASARAVSEPGPRLQARIARLETALEQASQPVTVRLQSDNRTRVAVYHVGELGSFETHELTLTPGRYTAVGRCEGYRDVRREFTVTAEQAPIGPIEIRCEERL